MRVRLLVSRIFFASCLLATLALAGFWVYTHHSPAAWQRTRWELTAATDEWWEDRILIADGIVAVSFTHQTAPAFVGQVVGAGGAIEPNRTQPSGVAWASLPIFAPLLLRDDAPRWVARLGLTWEAERPLAGSSEMFPGERSGARLHLALPTAL